MKGRTCEIHIKGLVQGVGFRPFIYRLANQFKVTGWVDNRNDGVFIHAQGNDEDVTGFIDAIEPSAPPAASIEQINVKNIKPGKYNIFEIVKSKDTSEEITEISPDIAVCDDCLYDLKNQKHRIDYPLINCTNCGPRFTIVRDLPYDRDKTTMQPFEMCDDCKKEYTDIGDRRFHAQPIACNKCGPEYFMLSHEEKISGLEKILNLTAETIDKGEIAAIKGMGGYFIACDALNDVAVERLRNAKVREGKPFAVMFSGIDAAKKYTFINKEEQNLLQSWRSPIVLLKTKKELAPAVSEGFPTTGAMLPYMPFHHLLFEKLKTPVIVLTSGNISDEPIIIDDEQAVDKLSGIAEVIVTYNRDIHNRVDDSVAFSANDKPRLVRRSRGYAPAPVNLNCDVDGIIGAGAELNNCFCVGKGRQAFLSQHTGDLKNLETLEFYEESLKRYKHIFRIEPKAVVCDLHPDYLSTKYAKDSKLKLFKIQHHHAHIVSCMAEHGIDEKVIGVAFDGTGLGTDRNIWGSEFFIADCKYYERIAHFNYLPLPGGDKVIKHPWRTAVAALYQAYGNSLLELPLPFMQKLEKDKLHALLTQVRKGINSPLGCSAGRLFDAVAAITNICTETTFHAEAPMRLEAAIKPGVKDRYEADFTEVISVIPVIQQVVEDITAGKTTGEISAKFHNTIIDIIVRVSQILSAETGIKKIVLSGGTFQNRYLLENTENKLYHAGFDVFSHQKVPSNDAGIALGQLMIAAKRMEGERD